MNTPREYIIQPTSTTPFFHGMKLPVYFVQDSSVRSSEDAELEQYMNDVYKMLVSKLTGIAMGAAVSSDEEYKLQSLLTEVVRVRRLLERNA